MKKYFEKKNTAAKIAAIFAALLFFVPFLTSASVFQSSGTNLTSGSSLQTGLVGYWTMDGVDTNWAADTEADRSGNGNTGTFISMSTTTSPVPGKIGQAINFNGSGGIVSLASGSGLPLGSSSRTVSAWIKLNTSTTQEFVSYGGNAGTGQRFSLVYEPGGNGMGFEIENAGGEFAFTFDKNWHNLTVVVPNGCTTVGCTLVYFDGAQKTLTYVGSGTTLNTQSTDPVFGATSSAHTNAKMNGSLDEVRIYNRGLSAAEIKQLYLDGAAQLQSSGTQLTEGSSLTSGLVGYWTMDGVDTNWKTDIEADRSGNGNTGSLALMSTTTSPVAGKLGQALSFNGSTNIISTPMPTTATTNISMSAWFYYKTIGTSGGLILYLGNSSANGYGMVLHSAACAASNNLNILIGGLTCASGGDSGFVVPFNKWTFVTLTRDSTTWRLYANGVQIKTSTQNPNTPTGNFFIGPGTNGFSGNMDEVRFYNRALSATEVKQLYFYGAAQFNAPSPTLTVGSSLTSGLVGLWTMDGGDTNWKADTEVDRSGNGNTGTLFNLSTTTSPVAGKIGQAMKFNGLDVVSTGSRIDTAAPVTTAITNVSLSAWFNTANAAQAGQGIVYNGSDKNANGYGWFVNMESETDAHIRILYGGVIWFDTGIVVKSNTWYHGVMEISSAGVPSFYLNGVLLYTGTTASRATPTLYTEIGRDDFIIGSPGTPRYFNGEIDDVRIYNRILSAAEVKQLYLVGH